MLNKVPVLDKGFVAMFSRSMGEEDVRNARNILYRNRGSEAFTDEIHVHLYIKSPIFVQLSLGSKNISWKNSTEGATEAYIPNINEIRGRDLESSELIAEDIKQTTEALLLNPKAYQADACDIFISQTIVPISVYNTYLASASLSQWIKYIKQESLPGPINEYRKAILGILKAEWPSLWESFKNGEKGKN